MATRFIEKPLTNHKAMQCRVKIYDDGTIELVSYSTTVLRAERWHEGRVYWVGATGLYWNGERIFTPSTAHQISYFLSEYFPDLSYPYFKMAAENDELVMATLDKGVNLDYGW